MYVCIVTSHPFDVFHTHTECTFFLFIIFCLFEILLSLKSRNKFFYKKNCPVRGSEESFGEHRSERFCRNEVLTWMKTVKYITAIVVVTNIGCSLTCFGSISSTKANATAPRKPPYDITNFSTLLSLWSRNRFARAVSTITPVNMFIGHGDFVVAT